MVKGKIIYDNEIMTLDEWEDSLNKLRKNYPDIPYPNSMEFSYLNEIQAHYFLIFNNSPNKISSWLRSQIKSQLGLLSSIIWDSKLDFGKNWEFYYVDVPKQVDIYRKSVFDKQSSWEKDKTLRFKGPRALRTLIKGMKS